MRMTTYTIYDLNSVPMREVVRYDSAGFELFGSGNSLLKFYDAGDNLVAIHHLPYGHTVTVLED
jgi:hypothetical protein